MPESILELAVEDAVDSLNGIQIAFGYSTDAIVTREHKEGDPPADGKMVVRVGDPVEKTDAPMGFDEYWVPVSIDCYCLPLNEDPTPIAVRLARMAADVRKCLMIDSHRGGFAIYTKFTLKDDFNTKTPPFSVTVTPYLWVRTLRGNPYAQS